MQLLLQLLELLHWWGHHRPKERRAGVDAVACTTHLSIVERHDGALPSSPTLSHGGLGFAARFGSAFRCIPLSRYHLLLAGPCTRSVSQALQSQLCCCVPQHELKRGGHFPASSPAPGGCLASARPTLVPLDHIGVLNAAARAGGTDQSPVARQRTTTGCARLSA